MNVRLSRSEDNDLFFDALTTSYVDGPRFVERTWLEKLIEAKLADTSCRYLLLTAEPGAGKTAFMAWLAHKHPKWLRYFIRRDQVSLLSSPSERSFLLHLGLQFATLYPNLFTPQNVEVTIRQRIGMLDRDATVVAAEIQRVISTPFMQIAFSISQEVEQAKGQTTGLKIGEWIADPRLILPDDLQDLALFDPAVQLLRDQPEQRIVILVDALDEVRYHDSQGSLLHRIANLPPLPANVCFVITSREDDELLRLLRDKQSAYLCELKLSTEDPEFRLHIENDLNAYVQQLILIPTVMETLAKAGLQTTEFISKVISKANGNLGYLEAIGRALDQAQIQNDQRQLFALLQLDELPHSLETLYAFFLHQVKVQYINQSVEVEDPYTGTITRASTWPTIYHPILGVLTVAREPLTAEQIQRFGHIHTGWNELVGALDQLRQFFDEQNGSYRFYHTTLPEFLTRLSTQANVETRDLYQEPGSWHKHILNSYKNLVKGWENANWQALDGYGWRHLTSHAEQAGRDKSYQLLFELCDEGFFVAKRQAVETVTAMEEDWYRVLLACRTTDDFGRFVRYGSQRSRQFAEVIYLQNTQAVRIAAQLATRQQGSVDLERLHAEIALIPQPIARLYAEEALFDVLMRAKSEYSVVDTLSNTIYNALNTLPSGDDRDVNLAAYITTLAYGQRPGWQDICVAQLPEVESFLPRIQLLTTLAQGYAADGNQVGATALLNQALNECQQFDLRNDDIVPSLIQIMSGDERVDPTDALVRALAIILDTAPVLQQGEIALVVAAAREQFSRIKDGEFRMQLETLAVQTLDTAGLHDASYADAHNLLALILQPPHIEVKDDDFHPEMTLPGEELPPNWADDAINEFISYNSADHIIELLAVLPVARLLGDVVILNHWRQCVMDGLAMVSSAFDLLRVAETIATLPSVESLKSILYEVLQLIGGHKSFVKTGDVGFAINIALASAYTRVDEQVPARASLDQILVHVSAESLGECESPEQAEMREIALARIWALGCQMGESALLYKILDWMLAIVPFVLPRDNRAGLWAAAITALGDISNVDLASDMLTRLKLMLVEIMDAGGYVATAWLQLAEAFVGLAVPSEAHRLLSEGLRIARISLPAEALVHILAWAARLYAILGDVQIAANLLTEALQAIADFEGDNIKAYNLQEVLYVLGTVSSWQNEGRKAATSLLEQVVQLAEKIVLEEFAIRALATVVHTCLEYDLPAPTSVLERLALLQLDPENENDVDRRLRTIMTAINALNRLKPEAARQLLKQVELAVERLPSESDYKRAKVCKAYADLSELYNAISMGQLPAHVYKQMTEIAGETQEPTWHTDACVALVRLSTSLGDVRSASSWITEAVAAWRHIDEWLYARDSINPIFDAWAAIPDSEVRRSHLEELLGVLWYVPDLNQRDTLHARLALSFWNDPLQFRELSVGVISQGGLVTLLSTLRESKEVPKGLLPSALYDVLEKASRLPRAFFAGHALLAAQIGVRHGILNSGTAVPVLVSIELMIREIAPLPVSMN